MTTDTLKSFRDNAVADSGMGMHVLDLPVAQLAPGSCVIFTMRWLDSGAWQRENFEVAIT
jgi:glucoamylase